MRILDASLSASTRGDVQLAFDTFGNPVALLSFHDVADELAIGSELPLRRYGPEEPMARIARYAGACPADYDDDARIDLGPCVMAHQMQDQAALAEWIAQAMPHPANGRLQVPGALSTAVHGALSYARREAEGAQPPAETIVPGSGTCRDFPLRFMDAARSLGFAARFVTR